MAKLRIEKANGDLVVNEYVNVVKGLFKESPAGVFPNYDRFVAANPNDRPQILQDFIQGSRKIQQETSSGAKEDITNRNCRIVGERDMKRNGPRSRVTVPIPPEPVTNFSYLDAYAKEIHKLYDAGEFDKCYKFMFGVMLLTRCR